MSSEKTEQPTQKKLRDSRKKGDVPNSTDFVTGAKCLAAIAALSASAQWMFQAMTSFMTDMLNAGIRSSTRAELTTSTTKLAIVVFSIMVLCCAPSVVVAALATFSRIGLLITFEKVTPNLSAVSPASGLKRMFSLATLTEFGKSLLKMAMIGGVLYVTVRAALPMLVYSIMQPFEQVTGSIWFILLRLCGAAAFTLFIIGLCDIKLQDYFYRKRLKMSKEEIKQENKQMDGNPQVKQERKKLHRALLNEPVKQKIGFMDFVVTNPTHYAVAVCYDPDVAPLPFVGLRGADEDAREIRESAFAAGVAVISNPPLARALYRLDEGELIPDDFLETIAGILGWVRQIQAASKTGAAALSESP